MVIWFSMGQIEIFSGGSRIVGGGGAPGHSNQIP